MEKPCHLSPVFSLPVFLNCMQRTFLVAKIHNSTLTGADLNYTGSISIDQHLLDAAGIFVHEQVQVVNINNGERLVTYAISAPPHSGIVELNGAAARLGVAGDRVIIMTYGQLTSEAVTLHHPTIIFVDSKNQIIQVNSDNKLQ